MDRHSSGERTAHSIFAMYVGQELAGDRNSSPAARGGETATDTTFGPKSRGKKGASQWTCFHASGSETSRRRAMRRRARDAAPPCGAAPDTAHALYVRGLSGM